MAYYVLDENNNKVEAFDKQGVLAILAQAIADGSLENITADSAFINKLKCCVSGTTYKIGFTTQAKYNELAAAGELVENTYYFIIDDTTAEDLEEKLNSLTTKLNEIEIDQTKLEDLDNDLDELKRNLNETVRTKTGAYKHITEAELKKLSSRVIYDKDDAEACVNLHQFMGTKECEDILGISGSIVFNKLTVEFNCLWSRMAATLESGLKYRSAAITASLNNYCQISFNIRIDELKNLDIFNPFVKSWDGSGSVEQITKIEIDELTLFYN